MKRMEPPPLASWLLEHLSPGERDEALAGDLLENYSTGRSDAWYWRQVLTTLAVAWYGSLRERAPLLVFAFLWSMLAPAWTVFVGRIQNNDHPIAQLWQTHWPLAALFWLGFHLLFLWGGILVFYFSLRRLLRITYRKNLRRALALTPVIFVPAFLTMAILMNLFAWPGLAMHRPSITPLGEVTDMGMWANALRIPYILTLAGALWRAMPRLPRFSSLAALKQAEHATEVEPIAVARELDSSQCKRFIAFMVSAGLLNAMIVGFLLCRLPDSHTPTLPNLFFRAVAYVAVGALAGVGGTWFYWERPASPFRSNSPVPFREFALVCASGWVWVPALVIFSEQISPAAAGVAMMGAYLLAVGLRNSTAAVFAAGAPAPVFEPTELFATSLYRVPWDAAGYVIAVCLFAAGAALGTRSSYTAAVLLGLAGFMFAWKKTVPRAGRAESGLAARRLVRAALLAVLVTAWALFDGVALRNRLAAAGIGNGDSSKHVADATKSESDLGGYQSIILWPRPEKTEIAPPIPARSELLTPGSWEPIIIRFDGPYYYFQPGRRPEWGGAHEAQGSPLAVKIESSNLKPLTIEAHQQLGSPVPLARCRAISVELRNRDNDPGAISLAVLLRDRTTARKAWIFLGQQPIVTTMPGHFRVKAAPAYETLQFEIPAHAEIRRFDEITVMLLPDVEHALLAPKISIEQFQLFPR